MEIAIIALLSVLVLGVFWLVFMLRGNKGGRESEMLQAQYESLRAEVRDTLSKNLVLVNSQLSNVTSQLNEQLSNVTMQLHASAGQISERMDSSARISGELRERLGSLSKATERLFEIGKDISGLESLLRSPKLRGGLGEFLLGDLLSQCLPSDHYELQYTFANGLRCDAVIKLSGGIVPIDSKFPLENFRRILVEENEEGKKSAKRKFVADCKKHIDAIASSYIRTEDGTFNFALMYIPAENVYYETIIKDEEFGDEKALMGYAFSKRVIPVSPNSFYAYLQTILLGLRGLEISERARQIFSDLESMKNEFERFTGELDTLGKHINNTKTKYDEVQKRAGRFEDKLSNLGDDKGMEAFESEKVLK